MVNPLRSLLPHWGFGLLISLVLVVGLFLFPPTVLAAETQLQWQGEQGYQVEARLIYPDHGTTEMVAIEGKGQPRRLNALTVRIYDPQGQELATYQNVSAGQPGKSDFLQLHFDPQQQQLRGWLDIGGAIGNEYFLKGQAGISLDLFYLDAQGRETKVDHNAGQVGVVPNPPDRY